MLVIHLLTVLAARSTPTVRAIIGKRERGIISQLRDQMEAYLSDHLHGIVMTEFPIEQKVHDPEGSADLLEQPLDMPLDEPKRQAQFHRATVAILVPLRPSSSATSLRWGRLLPQRLGGLFNLLGQDWVRPGPFSFRIQYR